MIGSAVGPYQVIARLGAGGMGEVYLGHDPRLQRRVALKCLTAAETRAGDVRARIMREARAAARLSHPNIAGVYDVLEQDDRTFIVMEYVDGESLAARMGRGRLPIGDVRTIGRQLASALAAAHAQGVIHRDLKPANIHFAPDGSIKVLDFGVAKMTPAISESTGAQTGGELSEVTLPGNPGTPIYMSPEQLFSHPIDGRSDIYSAGVVLFEMATGRRPYAETGAVALALAMTSGPPSPAAAINPEVPTDLSSALARALEREPDKRFQTARELEAALTATDEATATFVSHSPPSSRVSRWRRVWIPAAVAAVLLAIGVGARKPLMIHFGLDARPSTAPAALVVGILPPQNVSGNPRAAELGSTVTDVLVANLSSLRGTSVPRLDQRPADLMKTQRDLGAAVIFDSLVTGTAEQPQILVRLYKADRVPPFWERRFSGERLAVVRSVLREMVSVIASEVPARRLTPDERARLTRLPTEREDAMAKYSEAQALVFRPEGPDLDRAIALLQEATTLDPKFTLAWVRLGNAWWDRFLKSRDEASAAKATASIREAIAIDPEQREAIYSLANMQYRTGRREDAVSTLNGLLQQWPESAAAHRLLGEVLADKGSVDEALVHLNEAFRLDRHWNYAYTLGVVQYRAGRYDDAIKAFRTVTELAPSNPSGFQMLGTTYYVLGDVRQAIGNFEHAVRLGATASTYANLGLVYYDAGRFTDARDAYAKALELNPKSMETHRNIADVLLRLGKSSEARARYASAIALGREALRVNPRDVRTMALVALCEARLGRRDDAKRHVAEAVALAPTNRVALQRSAEVHALLNEPDEALRDLTAAIANGFEPRMAKKEDELASLRGLPAFERLTGSSSADAATKERRP